MKKTAVLLFCLSAFVFAKDKVTVKVVATHQVSREARDFRAQMDKAMMGSTTPGRTVEVFNLDTIINGEHVVLACEDDKGCEAPSVDSEYQGDMVHDHVHLAFTLPVTHKQVKRWYKVAGSW
jgi:hypothetical protein